MRLSYILIVLLFSSTQVGCKYKSVKNNTKSDSQQNEQHEYDDQVSNVLDYPGMNKFLRKNKCAVVYLLQTNKCNVCSVGSLAEIKASANKNSNDTSLIFLLTNHQPDIDAYLQENFDSTMVTILYDDTHQMSPMGLSFYKDVCIRICDKKIQQWKFIED